MIRLALMTLLVALVLVAGMIIIVVMTLPRSVPLVSCTAPTGCTSGPRAPGNQLDPLAPPPRTH